MFINVYRAQKNNNTNILIGNNMLLSLRKQRPHSILLLAGIRAMWTFSLLPRKGSKIYKNWSEYWPEVRDRNIRLRALLRSGGKGKKRDWSQATIKLTLRLEYLMELRLNGHTKWPPTQTFFGWQRGFPWRVMCDQAQISLVRSDLA